jgi:transposase-like protein
VGDGLSLWGAATALAAFGIRLSHMTVWRDLQDQAGLLEQRWPWQGVRVLGSDEAYPLLAGKKRPVLIVVDLRDGQAVAVGLIDEANPRATRRFLEPLVKRLSVSALVAGDLASFRLVSEKLGLEHQVCQSHVRRWVGRLLCQLRETQRRFL